MIGIDVFVAPTSEFQPYPSDVHESGGSLVAPHVRGPDEAPNLVGDQVEDDAKEIGARSKQMSKLKSVPVSLAKVLLDGGYKAMDVADRYGKPSRTAQRATDRGHLDWHRDVIAKLTDQAAPYASAEDLKKWVLEAYIEANVSQEDHTMSSLIWAQLWEDLATAAKNLPTTIATVVHDQVVSAAAAAFGIPTWAVPIGVAVGGAGLFYVLYKLAFAVAPTVAKRYLP